MQQRFAGTSTPIFLGEPFFMPSWSHSTTSAFFILLVFCLPLTFVVALGKRMELYAVIVHSLGSAITFVTEWFACCPCLAGTLLPCDNNGHRIGNEIRMGQIQAKPTKQYVCKSLESIGKIANPVVVRLIAGQIGKPIAVNFS